MTMGIKHECIILYAVDTFKKINIFATVWTIDLSSKWQILNLTPIYDVRIIKNWHNHISSIS